MKACKFCGKELKDDAIYCTQCGEDQSKAAAAEHPSAREGRTYEASLKPDGMELFLVSALGVMAVAFVAVIVIGIIMG